MGREEIRNPVPLQNRSLGPRVFASQGAPWAPVVDAPRSRPIRTAELGARLPPNGMVYPLGMHSPEPVSELPDRAQIIEGLVRLISGWGGGSAPELRALIAPAVERMSPDELLEMAVRSRETGSHWGYHPPDPFARGLSRQVMARVLLDGSEVQGASVLELARESRVVLVGNHLSYVDVNVLDHLCDQAGHGDRMERLAVIVGPKVYTEPIRRLASLCFGTIKTPQSSSLASGEAVMSPREVARVARTTLDVARLRVEAGDLLLLFPEGARSRSASMRACLPAIARYLEIPDLWIVPFAHTGCERLVPLEEDHVYPERVSFRLGSPIRAERLLERTRRSRGCTADVLGFWIADLLPEEYRGHYAGPTEGLEEAHEIAGDLLKQRDPEGLG